MKHVLHHLMLMEKEDFERTRAYLFYNMREKRVYPWHAHLRLHLSWGQVIRYRELMRNP